MSTYKKTAKDLAFEREKNNLKSRNNKLWENLQDAGKTIREQTAQIEELKKRNADLEKAFAELSENKFTPDQLLEYIKQTNKINDLFSMMDSTYSKYLRYML